MAMRWCKPHNRFYPPDADACPRCAARAVGAAVRASGAALAGASSERCHTCWDLLEVCRCGELDRGVLICGRRGGKRTVQGVVEFADALDPEDAKRYIAAFKRRSPELEALLAYWDRMRP